MNVSSNVVCFFLPFLINLQALCQNTAISSSKSTIDFYSKGNLLMKSNPDSAIYYFSLAEKLNQNHDTSLFINAGLTQSYFLLHNYDSAKSFAYKNHHYNFSSTKSKAGKIAIAKSNRVLARVLGIEGKLDSALQIYGENIFQLEKDSLIGKELVSSYNGIGVTYKFKNEIDSFKKYMNKVIETAPQINDPAVKEVMFGAYINSSDTYLGQQDLKTAKGYLKYVYDRSKEISPRTYLASLIRLSNIFIDQSEFDSADYLLKKGAQFLNSSTSNKDISMKFHLPQYAGLIYHTLGTLHLFQGNQKKAKKFYLRALAENKVVAFDSKRETGDTHYRLGIVYFNLEEYEFAIESFEKALQIYKSYSSEGDLYLCGVFNMLGELNYHIGEYETAKMYIDSALINNKKIKINNQVIHSSINYCWESFQIALLISDSVQNHIQYFDSVYRAVSNQLRSRFHNVSSLYNLEKRDIVINTLIKKMLHRPSYHDKIWDIIESVKSKILIAQKNNQKALFSNLDSETLIKARDLKDNISSLVSKNDTNNANQLIVLKHKYNSLIELFERQYPKYYNLKYSSKTASIKEVQNSILQANQTFVEYFVGDSAIYAFIVDKHSYEVKKISLEDSLNQQITNLPIYLKNDNFKNYSQTAYQLYEQLIEPLDLENENLIIVPDGILWHLNFDLLLSESPKKQDFRTLDYLIKKHNISYAYSATLLLQDLNSKLDNSPEKECLAFSYANPSDTVIGNYLAMRNFRNEVRQSLPGTQKEVKSIANVLQGDYYFGAFANEKNFKENAKNYKVLHLALHGEIDDTEPMNSKLIFSQGKDSLEDNYLHAFELYNTELNADLAVLSACNTGGGKIEKGEGIMSLGRAFSYAGCKSLLLSQWELSDVTTPQIMKSFYQNLQNGNTKSEALRNAKLDYLKNADNPSANPYYWGALIQLGNDEPIYSNNKKWWVSISILMALICGVLIGYKRKG